MLNQILERTVRLLPIKLQPFAKAIIPPVTALILIAANGFVSGDWDIDGAKAAVGLIFVAALTFGLPNLA